MPEISILTPLLFFIGANASEPYEEAMTRQIEDDVLRKFYIDMNPGHILYEPQSVSWVYHSIMPSKMEVASQHWTDWTDSTDWTTKS